MLSKRDHSLVPDRTAFALAALMVVGSGASVRAAPARSVKPPESVCEATPTLEEAQLITGRDLYARANKLFDEKDYLGAVKAWEQVVLLLPDKEVELRVQLAHAHRGAYLANGDVEHLHAARRLFGAQLDNLEPGSVARADIETELADIEDKLEAVAMAEEKTRTEREEAIRQTQIRLDREALAKAEEKHQQEIHKHHREIQKVYHGVGGSLTGLGLGSLAAMTSFLVKGARLDREGQQMAASTGVEDGAYEDLLVKGEAQNRAAIVTGAVGGVLLATGGSLLIVAVVRHARVNGSSRKKRVAVVPTLGGVQVRF